ncbi:protein TonB [Novosphingobium capsulatum]|uniref:Protein TonB n=1 Tax=Novosphingobium capsulatum TaxID=13688 RepID=A0ABU1MS00_9SPHN|nr:energy transducer TonB [Novosphingobium capsulatum]MDR6513116.1 protein TonB [Novosphingobium capsulatum]
MSSQASLIATPTLAPRPASSGLRGEVVPLRPATWQPARYEPSRPRGLAMIGAGAAVGALLVAFLSLGIVAAKPRHHTLTAVRLSADLTPPPPPPPQAAQQPPRTPVQPASPIVAPPPPITLALPAPTIATAPVAAPVVVPAPAPAAAPAPVAAPAPAAPAAPAIAKGRDLSANLVDASPPRYPIDSRRAREQGTVVLNVTVGLDGRVADIGLSRSSGFDRLDRAALAAVRHWRWTPTRQNGQTVMVQGLVSIPFVLQG